jgi:hypothetical protein
MSAVSSAFRSQFRHALGKERHFPLDGNLPTQTKARSQSVFTLASLYHGRALAPSHIIFLQDSGSISKWLG